MKKFLLVLAFMFTAPVLAEELDYGFTVPEWKDFAPSAYVDVEEPKGLGKLNEIASYWYKGKPNLKQGLRNARFLKPTMKDLTATTG